MGKEAKRDHTKEFLNLIQTLGQRYDVYKVWADLFELQAIRIISSVEKEHVDERTERVRQIRAQYDAQGNSLLNDLAQGLTQIMHTQTGRGKLADVVGAIYHELGLHNKWKGQFFTPQGVADMMALISYDDANFEKRGHITVYEPACGSGAMVLAMANALIDHKKRFYQDMVVLAVDADIKCAHMCYVQLSLYGVPAIVVHGNTLTSEEWSRWRTPMYYLGGWHLRNWMKD